ncbi:hypothetical protein Enr13x_28810 [Stieleria neptunia]|uniref:Uncharacterized protein n=1 Tax=Stieleria neptunia TaxID=2527979 RepID=A0A518HQ95_9BACT|nr:hypothetical protein [Stieleria neptunia]QDV43029.1 hypothetical protein Enr13x_28810 [Stieleria neptunia]
MHERKQQLPVRSKRFGSRSMTIDCGGIIAIVAILCSAGCVADAIRSTWQPYGAMTKRTSIKMRATKQARQVWEQNYQSQYASSPCADDVKSGYIAAYVETAMGMGQCPPPVPTRRLLSGDAIHQTYPAAVPWYQGYSFGHADAVVRGVDRWRLAPLNPDLAMAMCSCSPVAHDVPHDLPESYELIPQDATETAPEPAAEIEVEPLPIPDELPAANPEFL